MSSIGNVNNPVPNNVQLDGRVADIRSNGNRALNVRRDQDSNKNFTVKLLDIDTAIKTYLTDVVNPSVIDNGQSIKVPIQYATQEKWKAIQQDGVLRDQTGKLQLPLIAFSRTGFNKNQNLMTLNRQLTYPVVKKFDQKNRYDRFSILNNYTAPVNQVFNVALPDHIDVTYEFICWTEYIEQLNSIVQKINYACEDYWGDPKRFKFRVYADSFEFSTEGSVDSDRMVRSTFNLKVKAYLLEESFEDRKQTTMRSLTPRVVKIGTEIVSGEQMDSINDQIKSISYKKPSPYTYKDGMMFPDGEEYKSPSINMDGSVMDISDSELIVIRNAYDNLVPPTSGGSSSTGGPDDLLKYKDIWKSPPASSSDPGEDGWMAYDGNFHYIYVAGRWKRKSIADWSSF